MISARELPRFTPQEYFDWEAQQPERHEYLDGEVYAMASGSLPHADIALNVAAIVKQHLAGRCKVRNSDAKVAMSDNGPFTYPDVSVSCDDRDRTAQQFIQFPCLMVEVLSPGTEAYDRGGKFAAYRRLESLQEYVLVGSETKTVEVSRRNPSGTWEFIPYAEGDEIHFTSVDRDSRSTLFMKTSSWRLLLINLPLPNVAVGDRTLGRALGSAQSGC